MSDPVSSPGAHPHPPHPKQVLIYVAILGVLLALTGITVTAAGIDFGALNTPIALGIALLKATLVAAFFMHLRGSPRLIVLIALAGLLWLGIMIALTLADYASRGVVLGW